MRLLRKGVRMNLKKIRRIMAKYKVVCPIRAANPYRRMAKALKTSHVAPNLVAREFKKHGARKILLTDITYIKRKNGEFTCDTIAHLKFVHLLGYTSLLANLKVTLYHSPCFRFRAQK